MDILNLGLNLVAGAFTGYTTNNLAINMLFKEYGPFGGVILKTRQDFIKNVSQLVERDLIKTHALEKELKRPEVQQILQLTINDLLHHFLYTNFNNLALKDIPGYQKSLSNFNIFYHRQKEKMLFPIWANLTNNIKATDILSYKQLNVITKNVINILHEEIKNTPIIQSYFSKLYTSIKQKTPEEFLSNKLKHRIIKNISKANYNLPSFLHKNYKKDIRNTLEIVFYEIDFENILKSMENELRKKDITTLFNNDNKLAQRIQIYLNSREGKKVIESFARETWKLLTRIHSPLMDILPDDTSLKIEKTLKVKLPVVIDKFINWFRNNKREIEILINEAFNDSLNEDKSATAGIKKVIFEVMEGELAGKYQLVGQLIELIEEKHNTGELAQKLTEKIILFLQDKPIGDIAILLEKRGLIDYSILTNLINGSLEKIINDLPLQDIKFGHILPEGLIYKRTESIKKWLIDYIINYLLEQSKGGQLLDDRLQMTINKFFTSPIEDNFQLTDKELSQQAEKKLLGYINDNKLNLHQFILKRSFDYLDDKNIVDLFGKKSSKDIFAAITTKGYASLFQRKILVSKEYKISQLLDYFHSVNNLPEILSKSISKTVLLNLPSFIRGKIADTIAVNLDKVSDKDMQKMVEEFIGRELKPITFFGAFLGAFSALGLYYTGQLTGILTDLQLPLSMVVYGLVGYLTNVIAIKMIFRPYREKKIGRIKLPFTPGVVTKEKSRFARALGDFIEDQLLNEDKLKILFTEKKKDILVTIKKSLARSEYSIISSLLQKNKSKLAHSLTRRLLQYYIKHDKKIIDKSVNKLLKEKKLKGFLTKKTQNRILNNIARPENVNKIIHSIKKEFPFSQSISYHIFNRVLDDMLKNDLYIKSLAHHQALNKGFLAWRNQKINLSNRQISSGIPEFFVSYLQQSNASERIGYCIKNGLFKNGIENKFSLIINDLLNSNRDKLFNQGKRVIVNYLQLKRTDIKKNITEIAKNKLGFWFTAGYLIDLKGTIEKTTDNFLDKKLPLFINKKEKELKKLFIESIESLLEDYNLTVSDKKVQKILENNLKKENSEEFVYNIWHSLKKSLNNLKKGSLLKLFSINNLQDFTMFFDKELSSTKELLLTKCHLKKKSIIKVSEILIAKVIKNHYYPYLETDLNKIINKLLKNKSFQQLYDNFLLDLSQQLTQRNIEDICNLPLLGEDLLKTSNQFIRNNDDVSDQIEKSLAKLLVNVNNILERETKDFFLEIIIKSSLDAIEANILDFIKAMNTGEITKEEVNQMDAAEIEELFYSFAGNYLGKLELYGWSGSIIGLITELIKGVI